MHGRNDPCPCGSSKKYKQCCLNKAHSSDAQSPSEVANLLQAALSLQQKGKFREAEALYLDVLRISPNHPDALHLLGLLARQEGKYQLAVELISKAVSANPVAPLFYNLGNAYQSLGELEKAIEHFRKALDINPSYVAALNNLGIALQRRGDLEGAFSCFQAALTIQPDQAELLSNFGDALRQNNQTSYAIEYLGRAIRLNPKLPSAHLNFGKALDDLGQVEAAIASIKQALALNSDHLDSHLALAAIYANQGQFGLAKECIEHALRLSPDNLEAWASLAHLKKMSYDDEAWAQRALMLLNENSSPIAGISLNYALGKYFDETKQYGRAFHYFSLANQGQKRRSIPFDHDEHRAFVTEIIETHTKESVQQSFGVRSNSERPVFIIGMPRSGTSLMEQILASHPDVFGAGELYYWIRKATENRSNFGRYSDKLLAELINGYEEEMDRRTSIGTRFVDKMPANFLYLGLIHAAFPKARFIHMRRNPVDTCLSIYFQSFSEQHTYATDLNDLAFYYREYQRLMAHWRTIFPPELFFDMDYEDLVEDCETWGRKVIEFIGLEWDSNCLHYFDTDRKVGTASNWQVRQPIYKTSTNRWMKYQSFIGPLLPLLDEH